MTRYLLRRFLLSIPILLGITLITFAIVHLTPGGFSAVQMEMNPKISPDSLARLKELYGLNQPWPQQYAHWVVRLSRLDFGRSFLDQRPVLDKIADRLPATLLLSGLSMLVILNTCRMSGEMLHIFRMMLYSLHFLLMRINMPRAEEDMKVTRPKCSNTQLSSVVSNVSMISRLH